MFARHFLKRLFVFLFIIGLGVAFLFILNTKYQTDKSLEDTLEDVF